jgi:threonine/homoserine/homoserine lactone efflux protein
MPLWAAMSVGAAVFIGGGIFFALQDLGTANDYATIASFFLALLTAGGSLLSFMHSKREQPPDPHGQESRKPASRSYVLVRNAKAVQIGDHNQQDITVYQAGQAKKSKGKR